MPFVTVIVGTVILLLLAFWGIAAGKAQAQAQTITANVLAIEKSLGFFYNDQTRYPSPDELASPTTMEPYLKNFSLTQFASASCPETYVYKQISPSSYQLNFCLPAPIGKYSKGWNSITIEHN